MSFVITSILGSLALTSAASAQAPMISDKVPSAEVDRPVALATGEIVKGRLGNKDEGGKSHYWLVALTPGTYKVVIDVRRADGTDSNVGGQLEWLSRDGERLQDVGRINETDDRYRGVFGFTLKAPLTAVLRYSNSFTVSDYWLGVFKGDVAVPGPFFAVQPSIQPLKLGESASVQLHGTASNSRDAYYGVRLPAGDYKITTEYRRTDGRSNNVGGQTFLLDTDGMVRDKLNHANEIDTFTRKVATLSLADELAAVIKVRANFADELVTLKVERVQ